MLASVGSILYGGARRGGADRGDVESVKEVREDELRPADTPMAGG